MVHPILFGYAGSCTGFQLIMPDERHHGIGLVRTRLPHFDLGLKGVELIKKYSFQLGKNEPENLNKFLSTQRPARVYQPFD